ncbi:hypothetical protein PU69_22080 [Escherichia coli]|uniref:Uncharacterized protein n=1 Tax=Escherichia coli TaxID=562 RepID=A0A0B0VLE8_ECOLX|nr:hypothetical protein PU69_22080 [Escherichia coli]KIH35806.1 hypothetical protein PD07_12630 [Escherichia coli]KLG61376.1 hypothetical protein WQ95_12665 [Escherichia coli]KNF67214.1 hypothetical protein WR15_16820 [Escherichia coli]
MISLETSASFLGVQNTGASIHRDNKLQLTASGLTGLLPDFSGKDIFVSISVNSLYLRELIKYMTSIMRNNITISPPITTKIIAVQIVFSGRCIILYHRGGFSYRLLSKLIILTNIFSDIV